MRSKQFNKSLNKQKGFIMAGLFGAILFAAFFIWVMASTDGNERIEKTCKPTIWVGKAAVAATDLVDRDLSGHTTRMFESVNYGCRYFFWNIFYYEEWISQEAAKAK